MDYTGSGTIEIFGQATTSKLYNVPYRFLPGTIVYLCNKASLGKLETVSIKLVNFLSQGTEIEPIYVDTTNRKWREFELCERKSAVDQVRRRYLRQLNTLEGKIANNQE